MRPALLIVLLAIFAIPGFADAQSMPVPSPPVIGAKSFLVIDATTGAILAELEPDLRLPPASLTKIMTSYIAAMELDAGRINLTDQVPISVKAWRAPGSRMFVREGTTVSLGDLLKGIVVQSGNDASIAVAEHIAGSQKRFSRRNPDFPTPWEAERNRSYSEMNCSKNV